MTNLSEELIDKKYISIFLKVAWQDFARSRAFRELALYFLYSFMFTILYIMNGVVWNDYTSSDYTKPTSDSTLFRWYVAMIVGYCFMTIVITVLGLRKIIFKSEKHRKALSKEKEYLKYEQVHLHPFMVHEKLELEEEALFLEGMSGIFGTACVMKFNIFDFAVHVLTFLITLWYLVEFLTIDPDNLAPSIYLMLLLSVCLVLNWICTFLVLRLIPWASLFLISTVWMSSVMLEFSILFLIFSVPFSMIFWKTIYSWSNFVEYLEEPDGITEISVFEGIYKTFRMSLADYDYDAGFLIAQEKNLDCTFWWNFLVVFWVIVSNVVLINMLIGLMGNRFTEAYSHIRYMSKHLRLWWCYDVMMKFDMEQLNQFDAVFLKKGKKLFSKPGPGLKKKKKKDNTMAGLAERIKELEARLNCEPTEHSSMSSSDRENSSDNVTTRQNTENTPSEQTTEN